MKQKKMNFKNEQSISELQDNFKQTNLCVTGVPERERKQKTFEKKMAERFPNLMKTRNPQIHETYQTPSMRNMKKPTPRHITIKLLKTSAKERILKAVRGENTGYVQRNKDKDD